ncbi:MAG: Cytochrome c family protein [Planctomycetaceae bacterium]|nr:Cytochrome c family protein [Planctomycetaceae bacterium]
MAPGASNNKSGGLRRRGVWARTCISVCLLVSAPLSFVGCDFPGRPNPNERPIPADQVVEFGLLYRKNCSGCHGTDGKLGPAPPLNDALFRAIIPAAELKHILTKGRNGTLMPAFSQENGGTLTATQIEVLVHEIKGIPYMIVPKQNGGRGEVEVVPDAGGISPRWGAPVRPPANVPSYNQAAAIVSRSSAVQQHDGAAVFVRACAACHGEHGQGIAQGHAMVRTINDQVLLKLNSDQVLRRYAITGRPDLGMPNFAEPRPGNPHFQALTEQQVTDLVALLASWRQTTVNGK